MSKGPENNHSDEPMARILGAGLILLPLVYNPAGGSFLPLKRVVLYLVALGVAIRYLLGKTEDHAWKTSPGLLFGTLYVFWAAVSFTWSTAPLSAAAESAQLVALLVVFVLATQALSGRDFLFLAKQASVGGGVVGIVGILQYLQLDLLLLEMLGIPHLVIPSVGRPSATFGFRNVTASYLVGCLPLSLLAAATSSGKRKTLHHISAFLIALLLVYTRTRGAWLGALVGSALGVAFLIHKDRGLISSVLPKPVQLLAGAATLLVLASLDPAEHRAAPQKFDTVKSTPTAALASLADPTADRGRFTFWRNTMAIIGDHPILGVGLDNWEYHYPIYDQGVGIQSTSEPVRPHNDVLWVWSELGPVGLIGFLGFITIPVLTAVRRRSGSQVELLISVACIASIAGLFTHGMFSFLREQPAASLLLWVALLGLAVTMRSRSTVGLPSWSGHLAVALSLGAVAIGIAQTRFDLAFSTANTWHNRGNLAAALGSADSAIEHGVFDHRAAFLKGRILQNMDRKQDAIDAYRHALDRHPHYANTHHNLAGILASTGDMGTAFTHFARALEIRPTYNEARINYANALIRVGQTVMARDQLQKVVSAGDRVPEARVLLGAIALQEGSIDLSIHHLERAIELSPDQLQAHNNLAIAYDRAGRHQDALRAYRAVAELWRGDVGYLNSLNERIRQLESLIR